MDLTAGVAGAAARPQLRLPPAGDRDLHQGRRHCRRRRRGRGASATYAEGACQAEGRRRGEPAARGGDAEAAEGVQELPHAAAARRLRRAGGSCWTSRSSTGAPSPSSTSRSRRRPCPSGQGPDPGLRRYNTTNLASQTHLVTCLYLKPANISNKYFVKFGRVFLQVGKGLSKDDKAQKLALQHWLEAIDPRHRYGHNLHYYYDCWLHSESKQPFFYWLDVGEGKEINLEGKCSRSKLLSQCIKYLGPEREDYEVVIEDSKFMYRKSRQIIDTSFGPRDAKWIFVLSTSKSHYVGQKKKGKSQHSSFLVGGATSAAGRLVAENGTLKAIWPHSGHYRPTEENFQEFKSFLKDNLVDLTHVKMSPAEEDEEFWGSLKRIASENNKYEDGPVAPEETGPLQKAQLVQTTSTQSEKREEPAVATPGSSEDAKATEASTSSHMSENDLQRAKKAPVPREKILQRINSKKDMKSYQLGKQLSFKWSTGAGPRIGCVRDYPSELQAHALEQMNLSPRCATGSVCTRFASPLRRSFNSIVTRGCENETSTPRGELQSPLQHGVVADER
uniref:Uncharacterized protein n=1 Tax=Hordeum vulgare subsp. vulgare TaxID=112509 RepID=A0A8I7B4N7_HORVV